MVLCQLTCLTCMNQYGSFGWFSLLEDLRAAGVVEKSDRLCGGNLKKLKVMRSSLSSESFIQAFAKSPL